MVSPVAYIILVILIAVVGLNIELFFYARHESMLYEESVGLLSMSAILHQSEVNDLVETFANRDYYDGKIIRMALHAFTFRPRYFFFDEAKRKI